MADKKISQLTAATVPLAGSEVLPIVQSSTTVKVSVADVTKGRTIQTTGINDNNNNEVITVTTTASAVNEITVANAATGANPVISATGGDTDIGITLTPKGTGNTILTSGNLIPNTAASGINFTANTPAAGMTTQLLNWYEQGTFTPSYTTSAGAYTSVTYAFQLGKYVRVGNLVYFTISLRTSAANISGATGQILVDGLPFSAVSQSTGAASVSVSYASLFSNARPMGAYIVSGGTTMYLTYISNPVGSNWGELNATELSTGNPANILLMSGTYITG